MRVAIRADAGLLMGSGHVMRCLTLAEALAVRGAEVVFICRDREGHLAQKIAASGFECRLLAGGSNSPMPADPPHAHWLGATWEEDAAMTRAALYDPADLLVVDHYGLDCRWERAMRDVASRILVIDDLADRLHDADVLLDQNLGRTCEDYRRLVPPACAILAGTNYALLRREFRLARPAALERRKKWREPEHLLISMGGVDGQNITGRIMEALAARPTMFRQITIVLGFAAPHRDAVESLAAAMDGCVAVIENAGSMAELMLKADIAVGAAGATSWERCCLGLPTLSVVMAENQAGPARQLLGAGALLGAVEPHELEPDLIYRLLRPTPETYARVSDAAAAICDGLGVERVVSEIVR